MAGFACMECGHKFKTVKAAEKAAFGSSGCPKCGGSDIDLARAPAPAMHSDCDNRGGACIACRTGGA